MAKESRYLHVEGGEVRVMRLVEERVVSSESLAMELAKANQLSTGPLPNSCVFYSRRIDTGSNTPIHTYVLELAPHVHHMEMNYKRLSDPKKQFQSFDVSWPSTLFMWRLRGSAFLDLRIMATLKPFHEQGLDTPIYILPVPNIFDSGTGQVCVGNPESAINVAQPTHQQIAALQNHMMRSYWNDDLSTPYDSAGLSGLEDWHKKTEKDAEIGMKLKYREHPRKTFGALFSAIESTRS